MDNTSTNGNVNASIENTINILNNDIIENAKLTWSKLNKTQKIQKLNDYSEKYCKENNILNKVGKLKGYLKSKLEQKRLLTVKEVEYDKEESAIINIPNLIIINDNFILKRCEKRNSTLKSLTPAKKNHTQTKKKDRKKKKKEEN